MEPEVSGWRVRRKQAGENPEAARRCFPRPFAQWDALTHWSSKHLLLIRGRDVYSLLLPWSVISKFRLEKSKLWQKQIKRPGFFQPPFLFCSISGLCIPMATLSGHIYVGPRNYRSKSDSDYRLFKWTPNFFIWKVRILNLREGKMLHQLIF